MKILCCLLLVFTGGTVATIQPKSVNLALETVLQFDKKNHVADLEVITKVQKFLDNIRNVMSVYDGSRRSNSEGTDLKFTDFILEVVNILRSYKDSDLKQVFTVLDDESRKYNYKGCKFYELVDNHDLRRFMSRNLEDAKEIPLEELRNLLDVVATGIEKQKFKKDEKKLLSLVNSLYSGSEKRFTQVLSNLNNYATRRSSRRVYLRDIVSKGLKSVIFDFYSNLNPNARQSLKSAIHNYWKHYIGGNDRHANDRGSKKEENLRPNFIDITRYYNSDMHRWSAGAKRSKDVTIPTLKNNKKLNTQVKPNKPESLGLTVDLNSFKPVFQSFFNKLAFGAANHKKSSDDKISIKENGGRLKTKHRNVKHTKHETPKSLIEEKPLPYSFESRETDAGHEKSRTMLIPYDENETTTTKKKRSKKSRNKGRLSVESFIELKSDIGSEIRDLNEIQKKYDMLKKLESNLSPEIKSDKEQSDKEKAPGGLEFLVGGQKIQGIQRARSIFTKRKRGNSKITPERETVTKILSDHQAVIEVTESKELMPKKRLKMPLKTIKRSKKHRKQHKSKPSTVTHRRAKKKTRFPSSRKSIGHASNEGMSIESFENRNTNQLSIIRRNQKDKAETVAEKTTQLETNSKVVSILHKLQKDLDNVKARIKFDATRSTVTTSETPDTHSIESITDTLPSGDILPFWSGPKSAKTKTTINTTTNTTKTTKIVSDETDDTARREVEVVIPLNNVYNKLTSKRSNKYKPLDIPTVTTKRGSKFLRDTLFKSNNVTYNSKVVSPLQVLLNQTMERISSYINESIGINDKNNAKDTDLDLSDDISKSNERTESVTKSTPKMVTKASKTSQEVSFDEGLTKTTPKEKPKQVSQSSDEGENKSISEEKVRKGSRYLEEGHKTTVSKEQMKKGSQSLEDDENITVSTEKVKNESQSLEEREKSTVSKEKVKKETQSMEESKKGTVNKEKVKKGSQSLEESIKRTVPKEKLKGPHSSEEDEKGTGSEENVDEGSLYLLRDLNNTKSHDNAPSLLPDRPIVTTPNLGNVSLSTPSKNDDFNRTAEYEAQDKNIEIFKDESSRSNKSGTIPPELLRAADPALNDLLDPFNDMGYN